MVNIQKYDIIFVALFYNIDESHLSVKCRGTARPARLH